MDVGKGETIYQKINIWWTLTLWEILNNYDKSVCNPSLTYLLPFSLFIQVIYVTINRGNEQIK